MVLRFGKGSPFVDFRLPCGSGLDILVDPFPDPRAIAQAVERLDARTTATLALPCTLEGGLALRTYIPSIRLVICGSGPETEWLRELATGLGVASLVAGPENRLALGVVPQMPVDDWTAIALLFHDHEWEHQLAPWSLSTNAFYIGAMGGARARDDRRSMLARRGFSDQEIDRIRSPLGLIKRARDARVLALSVMSEVLERYEEQCRH